MAKQNVTFVERHVEKIVLGVSGGVFLTLVVLYLLFTPHTIEVAGERLGPQALYEHVRSQAERVRLQMRRKVPDESEGTVVQVPDIKTQLSPYDELGLPKAFRVAFAPLGPPVPVVEAGGTVGRIQLAEVLPPSPIAVTTGRGYMALAPATPILPGAGDRGTQVLPAVTKEWYWVAVFSAVHRQKQIELFRQADYDPSRQQLIVAGVEAERQTWLEEEGRWGEPEPIQGYAPSYVPVRREISLDQTAYGVSREDLEYLRAYRDLLEELETQSAILRPAFQQFLPFPLDWKVPTLAGVDVDFSRYGVVTVADLTAESRGPSAGREGLRGGVPRFGAVAGGPRFGEAPPPVAEVPPGAPGGSIATGSGQDVEPLWVNDLSVEPGRVYRYRLRLLVFNTYVGLTSELRNRQDAAKVVLAGQWSAWSSPIRVESDRHLFVNAMRRGEEAVKLEFRKWSEGDWRLAIERKAVGEPVVFKIGREEFNYESLLATMIPQMPYRDRMYRGGRITYRDRPTTAVVLIGADGRVEEHLAARDGDLKRKLLAAERERQKLMRKYEALQRPGSGQPSRTPMGVPQPAGPVGGPGIELEDF